MVGLFDKGASFGLTPYLFYDYAYLKTRDPLPDEADSNRLQGAGAGLKGRIAKHWTFQADGAVALEKTDQVEKGDIEVYGRVKYAFLGEQKWPAYRFQHLGGVPGDRGNECGHFIGIGIEIETYGKL